MEGNENKENNCISYVKLYENKKMRCSFKDNTGYNKFVTGTICDEDDLVICVHTIRDEQVVIRKDLISSISEMKKNFVRKERNEKRVPNETNVI